MVTYEYIINDVKAYVEQDGLQNVVYKVYFELRGTKNDVIQGFSGEIDMPAPDPDNFLPADQLTKEIVIGWIDANYGFEDVTNGVQYTIDNLKAQIEERINRKSEQPEVVSIAIEQPTEETTEPEA